nr:GPP34 family phosphoprotein [Nocardioides yefusunii]
MPAKTSRHVWWIAESWNAWTPRCVHKVVPSDLPRKEVKRRAKAIAEGGWATDAVRKAVEAVNAALMTSMVAATVVATS